MCCLKCHSDLYDLTVGYVTNERGRNITASVIVDYCLKYII